MKIRTILILFTAFFAVVILACISDYRRSHNTPQKKEPQKGKVLSITLPVPAASRRSMSAEETANYIRHQLTKEEMSPVYRPLLIYARDKDGTTEEFVGVGTGFQDMENGPQVITANHVIQSTVPRDRCYSIRLLRGKMTVPKAYLNRIINRSSEVSDQFDITVVGVGADIAYLKEPAPLVKHEQARNSYDQPTIAGLKIERVRSLISGKYVEVIGGSIVMQGTRKAHYLMVQYKPVSGESGTGYLDDCGGLWILHAAPDDKSEQDMIKECLTTTGRTISAITCLSGPYTRSAMPAEGEKAKK